MDFWTNDVKPYLCGFVVVAGGVYFLSPTLGPMVSQLPLISSLSPAAVNALLAGGYAAVSMPICTYLKGLY
jgi:hypothetical protein